MQFTAKGIVLTLVALACCMANAQSPSGYQSPTDYATIFINQPLSQNDPRYEYTYELLTRVLRATEAEFGEALLRVAPMRISRDRTLMELMKGKSIHVMAEAPKKNWVAELLQVDIPIRKGIQGFRIFVIHSHHESTLAEVNSLQQLLQLPTGSGAQWSTRNAMEKAGFNVVTGPNYDGLFAMLNAQRFVTFGRGVNEAYREVETHKEAYPDLKIDDHLLLHIPLPTYFYVTPTQPLLAKRIEKGLQKLIQSGEFDRFFYDYHCSDLLRSRLQNRRVFRIENPLVKSDLMAQRPELWLSPEADFNDLCADATQQRLTPESYRNNSTL